MGKILVLIVLALIIVAWFRARARQVGPGDAGGASAAPRQVAPEQMVTCAHCGLNLPAGEAVFDAAATPFCGAAHLRERRERERR